MATTQHAQTRSDFSIALNQIATERNIDAALVLSSIEEAIVAAYQQSTTTEEDVFQRDRRAHRRSKSLSSSRQKRIDVTPAFWPYCGQAINRLSYKKFASERDAVIKLYTTKSAQL